MRHSSRIEARSDQCLSVFGCCSWLGQPAFRRPISTCQIPRLSPLPVNSPIHVSVPGRRPLSPQRSIRIRLVHGTISLEFSSIIHPRRTQITLTMRPAINWPTSFRIHRWQFFRITARPIGPIRSPATHSIPNSQWGDLTPSPWASPAVVKNL